MENQCHVLILAGGHSSRMNFPKAYLTFEGRTFVEKIADAYISAGFSRITLVINSLFTSGEWSELFCALPSLIQIVCNSFPEKGRLFSIQTGLKNESPADFYFIHNVDSPFISGDLIKTLWANKAEKGYVVPTFEGKGGHPVLISSGIIREIQSLSGLDSTLKEMLRPFLRVAVSTKDKNVLLNINSMEDYFTLCPNKKLKKYFV